MTKKSVKKKTATARPRRSVKSEKANAAEVQPQTTTKSAETHTNPQSGAKKASPSASNSPKRKTKSAQREADKQRNTTEPRRGNWRVDVVRPDDLLVLGFEFFGLEVTTSLGRGPMLTPLKPVLAAPIIVMHFPPQHIAEEAFFETAPEFGVGGTGTVLPPPVRSLLAGPSRIAFKVPTDTEPIPYNLEALLEKMRGWEMSIVPTAQNRLQPGLTPVDPTALKTVTAIEFPYRLLLSPHEWCRWSHATAVEKERGGRVELWHTRLNLPSVISILPRELSLRAIWARDPKFTPAHTATPNSDANELRMSLGMRDRYDLVHLTSNSSLTPQPRPVKVERFMLSALGAWADLRGTWEPSKGLSVEDWRHRTTMGRDHYVRVVTAGYLFPFGHRASLITVTERKFHPPGLDGAPEGNVAYLRQRMYIIVREPEKSYLDKNGNQLQRQMPFKRVRIATLVTPNLDKPEDSNIPGGPTGKAAFWPAVGKRDFQFHLVAEDFTGQVCEFTTPLVFVEKSVNDSRIGVVMTWFNEAAKKKYGDVPDRLRRSLGAQKIAFAGEWSATDPGNKNDSLPVQSAIFTAQEFVADPPGTGPHFRPIIGGASVTIPALAEWLGESAPVVVRHADEFKNAGFGAGNQGQVVLKLDEPVKLDFNSRGDKGGAIIKPNLTVQGISRTYGPVGDLASVAAGKFDASVYFKPKPAAASPAPRAPQQGAPDTALPVIFGALNLVDILPKGDSSSAFIPSIKTISEPNGSRVLVEWNVTQLQNFDFFSAKAGAQLKLRTDLFKPLGQTPIATVDCSLLNFRLELFKLIALEFKQLQFKTEAGKTPDVNVNFGKIEFIGDLKFLNELTKFIPSDGFSDPPSLDVSPQGISAGYSLALPPLAVGAFSLQNVTLGALFQLPFVGAPISLDFNFCRRDAKFLMTVGPIGGGGFFEMRLTAQGVQAFDVGIEGGACISINFGVAKGQVGAMLGINFHHEDGVGAKLDAYLRVFGAVEVLGIMAVNIEMSMSLDYDGSALTGHARISVEIDLGLFSKTVTIKYSKTFAGSPPPQSQPPQLPKGARKGAKTGAPLLPARATALPGYSFKDFFETKDIWITYCEAFV